MPAFLLFSKPLSMNTLHLVFHPNLAKSRANRIWKTHLAEQVPSIGLSRDMYAEHPNFTFDVAHEHELLIAHEQIILQFPLYWYAPPPLLKKWLDDVHFVRLCLWQRRR